MSETTETVSLSAVMGEIQELLPRVREIVAVQRVVAKLNNVVRGKRRKTCAVLEATPPVIRRLHALRAIVAHGDQPVKFILQSSTENKAKRRYVKHVANGGRRNVWLGDEGSDL